ncbi:hypothetical protein A4X13_0g5930 [Tilletia indica]|uniref:Uncharacterized protein n=1 Tax=Tilletia indica TaxID=43049 RepID=A0A8T8SQV4_9BASI|nr:hypothetical protein A4X13_0g5930 [Tilletia indica]
MAVVDPPSLSDTQQDRSGKTVATTQLVRRDRRLGDGRQVHSVSGDDWDDKAKDDLIRQGAARQRTVTPRRRFDQYDNTDDDLDSRGRDGVAQGTVPQETQDICDGLAITSTRQDEDGDGCGERRYLPQSVQQVDGKRLQETKDRSGGTNVRNPQRRLGAGAPGSKAAMRERKDGR